MSFWQFMSAWDDTHEIINPKNFSEEINPPAEERSQEVLDEEVYSEKDMTFSELMSPMVSLAEHVVNAIEDSPCENKLVEHISESTDYNHYGKFYSQFSEFNVNLDKSTGKIRTSEIRVEGNDGFSKVRFDYDLLERKSRFATLVHSKLDEGGWYEDRDFEESKNVEIYGVSTFIGKLKEILDNHPTINIEEIKMYDRKFGDGMHSGFWVFNPKSNVEAVDILQHAKYPY